MPSKRLQLQKFSKLPNHNACRYADIQRVLGSKLRNLQATIAHIHDVLLDTLHLVAEDDGVAGREERGKREEYLPIYFLEHIVTINILIAQM